MSFNMSAMTAALPTARRGRSLSCKAVAAAPGGVRLRAFEGFHASSLLSMGPAESEGLSAFGVENGCKWSMMRHGKKIARLGRPADQRKALLRALTTEVLRHGAIKTTKQKAKAVRPWVDKIILLAKAGGDAKMSQAKAWVYDHDIVKTLFEGVPERYANRTNDFTKMTWAKNRRGDNAEMVLLELVD